MMLVLLGNGVVAGVLLKRSKAEGGCWPVIAAGWAFAVMAGVFPAIACGSSDAHLNPAVTLGSPCALEISRGGGGSLSGGAAPWRHPRRRARLAALLAALERDPRRLGKTRLF